jgi:hypothetical protein
MPRFFFNDRSQPFLDPEGVELPDLASALVGAAVSARQLIADELRHGPVVRGRHLTITAEDGQLLATVALADCLFLDT